MGRGTGENVSGQAVSAGQSAQQRGSGVRGGTPLGVLGNSDQVRAAVEAERARIAREMDGAVGKSLLGVSMLADSLVPALQATTGRCSISS